ncbi:MAG TPA: DUF5715 family protein [Longimicrobiales bacterium]
MPRVRNVAAALAAALACATANACAQEPEPPSRAATPAATQERIERALGRALDRITARADSIDDVFQPVPFLTASQEAVLRSRPNREHVARARRLGIPRTADAAERDRLLRAGDLVVLEDSTRYWVVRELEDSSPLVVPDTRALLVELGRRFQARLAAMGVPPFRLEVTSVLRTAEDQAALRATNPNAASGVSSHEFGTTVDVAYSGFAAPVSVRPADVDDGADDGAVGAGDAGVQAGAAASGVPGAAADGAPDAVPWLEPYLRRIEASMLERVAARRSGELKAILGHVLREMQAEGKVLVTLERQQPVYHLTVARRLEGAG